MRLKLGLERGCLAVGDSVLQADHRALKYLGTANYENNRVMRGALKLQAY